MKRGLVEYGVLIPVKKVSRNVVDSAIDLSSAIRDGIIYGYYDARHRFHEVRKEEDPRKIVRNAVTITLVFPAGTVLGPLYLAYKGGVYLIKGNSERAKEGSLAKITE